MQLPEGRVVLTPGLCGAAGAEPGWMSTGRLFR